MAQPSVAWRTGPLEPRHRAPLAALLGATGVFRPAEVAVALELFDEGEGADYHFLGAFTPTDALAGYVCFGPTPATDSTYDLYWLAVDPAHQGVGVGTLLARALFRRLAEMQARAVVVETSSRTEYAAARALYGRLDFTEAARVRAFYAPGDDRVLYIKRLTRPAGGGQGHHE